MPKSIMLVNLIVLVVSIIHRIVIEIPPYTSLFTHMTGMMINHFCVSNIFKHMCICFALCVHGQYFKNTYFILCGCHRNPLNTVHPYISVFTHVWLIIYTFDTCESTCVYILCYVYMANILGVHCTFFILCGCPWKLTLTFLTYVCLHMAYYLLVSHVKMKAQMCKNVCFVL